MRHRRGWRGEKDDGPPRAAPGPAVEEVGRRQPEQLVLADAVVVQEARPVLVEMDEADHVRDGPGVASAVAAGVGDGDHAAARESVAKDGGIAALVLDKF